MRIFGIEPESVVDGPGYRAAVFVQGCPHRCPGCHNPDSHDPQGGREMAVHDVAQTFLDNPLLEGITLTGGEPFQQPRECVALASLAHQRGLNVWAYTGYTLEELIHLDYDKILLLLSVDVLVDGPFILSERTLDLPWRGSKNQRVIDMNKTRRAGKIVLYQHE